MINVTVNVVELETVTPLTVIPDPLTAILVAPRMKFVPVTARLTVVPAIPL